MNNITLVGRITKDLNLVENENSKFVKFTIACDRKSSKGKTDFIPVIAWGTQAENTVKYSGKGKMVVVQGSLYSTNYSNKDGESRTSFEVNADYIKYIDWKSENKEE